MLRMNQNQLPYMLHQIHTITLERLVSAFKIATVPFVLPIRIQWNFR